MAFNPFEAFSIRSKLGRAVMAILGIVVMLTFVLSTGVTGRGNDFFDQIGAIFGGGKSHGDVVAVAYGDDIHEADLREISRQRQAANAFLIAAIETSYSNWARELKGALEGSRLSLETKRAITPYISLRTNPATEQRAAQLFLMNQSQVQQLVIAGFLTKQDQAEDKKAIDAVQSILAHDLVAQFNPRQRPPVFPDMLFETDRDRLDFAIVLKKADKFGINYSRDAVRDLVARQTNGRLSPEDSARIEHELRNTGRFGDFTGDWLVDAIGNEFRARDAYAAFQGQSVIAAISREQQATALQQFFQFMPPVTVPEPSGTASALPGAVTPYDFWEYYKDRCTENTFSLLELSAESFLDQVKGEPTPKERIELFNKFRGELPDPSRPTPGFREPRKVKVEFVTLDAKAERVTKAIPQVQAASAFLCASAGAMTHNPASALLSASEPGLAETLPIKEAVSERMQANLRPYMNIEKWEFNPRDTSVFRPQPIISALGVLAGGPDVTTFVAAIAAVHQHVEIADHRTRIPFLLQPVLTPFNPTIGNAIGMPALALAHAPKQPPEGLYLGEVIAEHKKRQRQELFLADVRQLEEKLFKIKMDAGALDPNPDKAKVEKARAEARKYLTDWLKDRGLTPVGTKEPKDQFALVADPDLKTLNDVAAPEPDGSNSLIRRLFATDQRSRSSTPKYITESLDPFWFPAEPVGDSVDKPNHFVWISEEIPPNSYNSLDNANKQTNGEMTRRVDRAWKLEKARGLAKAEADRLAEQVRAIGKTVTTNRDGVEKQLRDLAAEKNLRKLEIERLAKLKFEHGATQAQYRYEPPTIDRKLIVYPTPDFADHLLELRTQPLGSVTVLPDNPRTHFYVACVVERLDKKIEDFRDSVFTKTSATGPAQNPLYFYALREDRDRAMEDVRVRLRADAKLEEKDAFKTGRREE